MLDVTAPSTSSAVVAQVQTVAKTEKLDDVPVDNFSKM